MSDEPRAPWEAPDDPDADDTAWRGDAHPAIPCTDLYPSVEYKLWLEQAEKEQAIDDLLREGGDEQC